MTTLDDPLAAPAPAVDPGDTLAVRLLARDVVPDWLIRRRIRSLLAQRLQEEEADPETHQARLMRLIASLRESPIAVNTAEANEQHYEVPTAFFQHVLGRHLKYSCCQFDLAHPPARPSAALDEAEARMLALTAQRAGLVDGDRILELGCGWGSLSLWMAEHFPNSQVTGVSNSRTQKLHIDAQAQARGLANLRIVTCDANVLEFPEGTQFDRVVSVEMFEHVRNYQRLLDKVASWMAPQATLFVHIFTHYRHAYRFEVKDASDFMSRYFFTGGIMPSNDLLLHFQDRIRLREQWLVDGRHYQLTSEAWLENMDRNRATILPLLAETYGAGEATRWWAYWRVFFMACAELWGYAGGREWMVSHYLFEKR